MRLTSDPHGHFAGRDFVVVNEVLRLRLTYDHTDPLHLQKNPAVVVATDMCVVFDAEVRVDHVDDGAFVEIVFGSACVDVRVHIESGDTLCLQSYPFDVVQTVRFMNDDPAVRDALTHVVRQNDELKSRVQMLMLMFVNMCEVVIGSTGAETPSTAELGKRKRPDFRSP